MVPGGTSAIGTGFVEGWVGERYNTPLISVALHMGSGALSVPMPLLLTVKAVVFVRCLDLLVVFPN